jgi:hypothetical protein
MPSLHSKTNPRAFFWLGFDFRVRLVVDLVKNLFVKGLSLLENNKCKFSIGSHIGLLRNAQG